MLVEDELIPSLVREADLLVEALSVCTSESRFLDIESTAMQVIQQLLERNIPKALWLKSKLPNLGERSKLSECEFDEMWMRLIKAASSGGAREAEYDYACVLHERGEFEKSIPLYKSSALKGYSPSLWCYGLELFQGEKIAQDIENGLFYIHISAELGYEYAGEFLINQYSEGCNLPLISNGRLVEKLKLLQLWGVQEQR